MNIAQARETALWQKPDHLTLQRKPKLDSRIEAREHVEGEVRNVIACLPGSGSGYYRIRPDEWMLLQFFDGERSWAEIAEAHAAQTGTTLTEDQVREFADGFAGTDFFYKTPVEKSRALLEEQMRAHSHRQGQGLDFSDIILVTINPDAYLDRLHHHLRFIYTRWFTLLTLASFALMAYILADRWSELWRDSVQYYDFTEKSLGDLADFYVFFGLVVFFHETAHGLTCKHWGGHVPRMGFALMWLLPTFFCDVTEAWVYAGKWQRIGTTFAGIWAELMMCAVAAVVWWGTVPGMMAHDFAYKVLLVAGIAVIVLNLNPLIKLDGYYIFTELIGMPDLKERSTAYISDWWRRLWGLPSQLEYVRTRRKWFFIIYAILSDLYSYVLLFVVYSWTYNIARSYSPEWAFVPACLALWLIFRTRITRLVQFMKTVYLDKKDRLKPGMTWPRLAFASAILFLFLFAPVWRDTISGPFVLESPARAVVRAQVPGRVNEVHASEGQTVDQGTELLSLSNTELESGAARLTAELQVAAARATRAQIQYSGFAEAEQQRQQLLKQQSTWAEQLAQLHVTSPISGVVVTPRPADLAGSYVIAGTPLVEVAQTSAMRARIFAPESDIRDVHVGTAVSVSVPGSLMVLRGTVASITPAALSPDDTLVPKLEYRGYERPQYYVAFVDLPNPGGLREGMHGTAKLLVRRRSIAGFCWEATRNFFSRRIW